MRIFLSLMFIFCSSAKAIGKTPSWVNSPAEFCGHLEVCVVGTGQGKLVAEAAARNSMALFFKAKIESSETVTTSMTSKQAADGTLSGEVDEEDQKQIIQTTSEVLDGIEIRESFEDAESFYILASLNKSKAAKRLKSKMKEIDEKMQALVKENKRSSIFKGFKLLALRNQINKKYELLKNSRFKELVSFEKLSRLKRAKDKLAVVVFVQINSEENAEEFQHEIVRKLLDLGLKVVLSEDKTHQYKIMAELKSQKAYINVKGFSKYKFSMEVESKSPSGKKIGGLNFENFQVGRNEVQAYNKMFPELKEFLEENLGELNID
jgi:hypothetical protein